MVQDHHPLAYSPVLDAIAHCSDHPSGFMAKNAGGLVERVENFFDIGLAEPDDLNLDEDLIGFNFGTGDIFVLEGVDPPKHLGLHDR
jgi:hypothetical protein